MQVLKLDYLVDSLILLLHDNKPEYQNLIQKVIAIFETEKPGVVTVTDKDNDVGKLYIYLIKEVMELGITVEDKKDIDAFILKFKSNPLLTKDPELFTTLKGIFTDLEPLEEDRKTRIIQRLSNEILINSSGELMKRAFGRLANVADDLNKQQAVLKDITDICAEVVKMNEDGVALTTTEDENIARTANFANKEELTKALKVYNTTTVVNRFKTGLQAMNRALNGGFAQGSSIVFAALAYSGKAARNGTLVHTPHGKVPIETLKVGDEVMAWDGTVTKVTGVFPQGIREIFAVAFPGVRHVEVDREHLWTVTTSKNATVPNGGARFLEDDTWQVCTTGEILEGMRSGIDYFIPAYRGCDKVTGTDKLRIASIMRSGEDDATCISVEHPDKLFVIGDYIVTHNSLMLMKMARWVVTMNTVSGNFKNPTCIFYSLENEVPQNLMQLFREMYVNEFRAMPPENMTMEDIVNYCYDAFNRYGWKLIIERKVGGEFGFQEFVASYESYVKLGYTPLVCVIDYVNLMAKGKGDYSETGTNNLQIQQLYNNLCNFTKSRNCTLITAHQLNRKAAEIARMYPMGAVKKFGDDMMADSMSVRREVDILFYMHKEFDAAGNAYMTFRLDKHRYNNDTPEKYKCFAYPFFGELGLLDDINGQDTSTDNIFSYEFDRCKAEATGQEYLTTDKLLDENNQNTAITTENGQINLFS